MSAATLEIVPVRRRAERRAFVGFPYRLYRATPEWTPPLRRDVFGLIDSRRNPFFEHGAVELFLARRAGRVVGRIAAIENRAHAEAHGDGAGFFGLFELEDDVEVARALLAAAASWLGERGLRLLRGPVSLSTNDECGVLVDGFDAPATILTPYNPRYYPKLIEAAGLAKCRDLYQYESELGELPERIVRTAQRRAERSGIAVRELDLKRYDEEMERVKQLYNLAWEANWGFVPLSGRELDHLAKELRPLVVPGLVAFAERAGKPVGLAIALPDANVALRTNPSGRLFPGLLRVFRALRRVKRMRVLVLGVDPEVRGSGVDALLVKSIWQGGRRHGIDWTEAGWVLEDNVAMNNHLVRLGFRHYKTLRLYERKL